MIGQDRLASLLGRAALDVWGDMPRDIQEALFETAMRRHDEEREPPQTLHPESPTAACRKLGEPVPCPG